MKSPDLADLSPIFPGVRLPDGPLVIAGPCSAESRRQVADAAAGVADAGVRCFRAGAWKPRTRPGGFEGFGASALRWIVDAAADYGLAALTEVATPRHLAAAMKAGCRAFWIGARTSANPFAVQDLADAFAAIPADTRDGITVLVKNPVNPDLDLWIGALQRVYNSGIRRLAAVHRGFSSYAPGPYRNIPEWKIPLELHRRYPALPLLCDPSHIGGRRELVKPIAQQALDMKFDGLIIESHCNPDAALSDSAQQVTPASLKGILASLKLRRNTGIEDSMFGKTALSEMRARIDSVDSRLVELLAERMRICDGIGRLKMENNMPVVQPERFDSLMRLRVEEGVRAGLSPSFIEKILSEIHQESVARQIALSGENDKSPQTPEH